MCVRSCVRPPLVGLPQCVIFRRVTLRKKSQGFGGIGENSQGFLFAGFFRPAVAGRKILRFFDRFSSGFLYFSKFPGLTHGKSGIEFSDKTSKFNFLATDSGNNSALDPEPSPGNNQ